MQGVDTRGILFVERGDIASVQQIIRKRKEKQMLYPRFAQKGINMITKLQGCDLERSFVCRSETSNGSVRHVS